MDAQSLLLARMAVVGRGLRQVEHDLSGSLLDEALRARVRARFEREVAKHGKALASLGQDVAAGQPLEECWNSFRDLERECSQLFRETLACVQGALLRRAGGDGGLCAIADALLDQLSRRGDRIRWDRFTIMADGESFADLAEIIRLRYPEGTIWNLPVAAHEFGHFLGPVLEERSAGGRSVHPFQDLLEREARDADWMPAESTRDGPRIHAFAHEYFADTFATYALGPAYACTSILLRLDPASAQRDGSSHPAPDRRVYAVLRALESMDAAEPGWLKPYAATAGMLRGLWQDNRSAAGVPGEFGSAALPALDRLLDEMYALLDSWVPGLRYDGGAWLRAQQLAGTLRRSPLEGALGADSTIADVLNAAWLCRLELGRDDAEVVRAIGERALSACRALAAAA